MDGNDITLIDNIKLNNCEQSLSELIQRHTPLCYDIYRKYAPALAASGSHVQEISQDKDYIVYKSALSYKSEKNVKFSTWLGNQIRFQCLNTINHKVHYIFLEEKELNYHVDKSTESGDTKVEEMKDYIFDILNKLRDTRIREIFHYRYFAEEKKMSWSKIGGILNISTQTVINLHAKGKEMLRQKLLSKECFDEV